MQTIDLTPTWGEVGSISCRLAESGETRAVKGMRSEVARAMAAAQALQNILKSLTPEQDAIVSATLAAELSKQGY